MPREAPERVTSTEEHATETISWAKTLLDQAKVQKFWGKLVIHMEDGKVARVENQRVLKPPARV